MFGGGGLFLGEARMKTAQIHSAFFGGGDGLLRFGLRVPIAQTFRGRWRRIGSVVVFRDLVDHSALQSLAAP